ncbi:MAG: T9SS type A sorting domain-containing protein [Chitinophagaceae bacterium]
MKRIINLFKTILKTLLIVNLLLAASSGAFSQVTITAGTNLTTAGDVHLVMADMDFINDGVVNLIPSTVAFTGTGNNIIKGGGFIDFHNLTINKSNGKAILIGRSLLVKNEINFSSGFIELNNNYINLQNTGKLINENENSRITGVNGGTVIAYTALHFPNAANPGNLGAIITAPIGDMGNTVIKRGHISKNAVDAGGKSINRYFEIEPASNIDLDATIKFTYFDAELNGISESGLSMYTTTDGLSFNNINATTRDANANYVTKNGIGKFAIYTLSSPPGAALPVKLVSFNATCKGNFIQLNWKTASEQNSDRFDIQRSANGIAWETIGFLKSAGNSKNILSYQYDDKTLNVASAFYRLAQYDLDGKIVYSNVAKAGCGVSTEFKIMPNPVADVAKVIIGATTNGKGTLLVFNAAGQQVIQQAVTLLSGINQYQLNMGGFANGTYNLLFIQNGAANQSIKIIKQ